MTVKKLYDTYGQNPPESHTKTYMPAEWEEQTKVQLTWPHSKTDWAPILKEAEDCFIQIAKAITSYEEVLIVADNPDEVWIKLSRAGCAMKHVRITRCSSNDTWARDHGAISVYTPNGWEKHDFCFNGWGLKFAADKDNQITNTLVEQGFLNGRYVNQNDFVLEGGSIETDGQGTLMTTWECMINSPNRNNYYTQDEIEERLKKSLHQNRILWLFSGHLVGDDTDGHVDTLARFCSPTSIAYVSCDDTNDTHYEDLKKMEEELCAFRTKDDEPYVLFPLPLPDPIYFEGERLPATYANFLIVNNAVLVPTYNQRKKDKKALSILGEAFPNREIIGIDCRALIKQHGSLHCVTMQYYG